MGRKQLVIELEFVRYSDSWIINFSTSENVVSEDSIDLSNCELEWLYVHGRKEIYKSPTDEWKWEVHMKIGWNIYSRLHLIRSQEPFVLGICS